MSATREIRALLRRQRDGALKVLARFHPLALDLLSSPAWNRALLHRNPRLPWLELLEAPTPPFAIDWRALSSNPGLRWPSLIERFVDRWDWPALSSNPELPWSPSLIERFVDRWDWLALSGNRGLPFDRALIERFGDRWVVSRLAANTAVAWDAGLVDELAAKLDEPDPDWHPSLEHERPTAVAPGIRLCATGWDHLMQNPAVAWADVLDRLPKPKWWLLSGNPGLPWSEELIRRHRDQLDPAALAANPELPWTPARIEQLLDAGQSLYLSGNPGLPWSEALVRRHADRWAWHVLSGNPSVPWTVALLEPSRGRLDWDRLSSSGALTPAVLEHFCDRLDWDRGVSCNRTMVLSPDLLEAHADRFNWERLSWHPNLPWGDALLLRFCDRWVVRSFERTEAAWAALARHLDDDWIRALVG